MQTTDNDTSLQDDARDQRTKWTVSNIISDFPRFAGHSMPVSNLFVILYVQGLAALAAWNLVGDFLLALFWPAAIGMMADLGWRLLIGFGTGWIIVQGVYWGVGVLLAAIAEYTKINLSTQSLRHLLLFAGLPVYIVGIVDILFFAVFNFLLRFLTLAGIETFGWEQFFSVSFAVLWIAGISLSVVRFYQGVSVLASGTGKRVYVGVVTPVMLMMLFWTLVLVPTPISTLMADNIEAQYEADAALLGVKAATQRYFAVGRYVIPESDLQNHMRFSMHTPTKYSGSFSYGSSHKVSLEPLMALAEPQSAVYYKLAAADALAKNDYPALLKAYEQLIQLDSNDFYHRRALVELHLDKFKTGQDAAAARPHALYLKQHTGLRRDIRLWGMCNYYVGDFQRAYDILHPLMLTDQYDSPTIYYLALASMQLKRYKMAHRCFGMTLNRAEEQETWVKYNSNGVKRLQDSVQQLLDQQQLVTWQAAREAEVALAQVDEAAAEEGQLDGSQRAASSLGAAQTQLHTETRAADLSAQVPANADSRKPDRK